VNHSFLRKGLMSGRCCSGAASKTKIVLKQSLLATALALVSLSAAAANYFVVVPVPGHTTSTANVSVTLNASALPQGVVGESYAGADLKSLLSVTGDPAFSGYGVKWSLASGDLPAGLTLNADGTISGTPTVSGSAPFSAMATYKTRSGAQRFQIVVVEITVKLASATLPSARLRRTYAPYDFRTQLQVDNDPAYDASKVSFDATGLPDGMSLSPDGLLSGTPTTENTAGAPFQVVANYKDKTGQQVYTLAVNGVYITATQIAPGGHHTCVITPAGKAQCWGANWYGQLGDGTKSDSPVPVDVVGLPSGLTSLSAGYVHTCATANGAAYCWGANSYGQLGNGSVSESSPPAVVAGLASGVTNLAAGYYHTCATVTGAAKCWGVNANYQLGNNSTTNSPVPVQVTGLTAGVGIVAGTWYHTCATVSGALKCWGAGTSGQLGNGSTSQSGVPVQVSGLTSGVTSFALGGNFTCAVANGAASCWGLNSSGQLGNGTMANSNVPVPVSGLGLGVTNISTGNMHACATMSGGAAKCWGYNNHGQVGNNSTANTPLPTTVIGLASGVSRVVAGYYFNCALLTSGNVKCWGDNSNGQLGDSTLNDSSAPVNALAP
jgi:alpha-tubulin suppressor-like RCC1 family protein